MAMTKEELIIKTAEWARERGLHLGSHLMQALKLAEEAGELIGAHLKLKKGPSDKWRQVQKDSVGDMLVVMGVTRAILVEKGVLEEFSESDAEKGLLNVFDTFDAEREVFDRRLSKNTFLQYQSEVYLQKIVLRIGNIDSLYVDIKGAVVHLREIWVLLQKYCLAEGLDIYECWELAYNEVAQRKGKTIGGVFVKNGD